MASDISPYWCEQARTFHRKNPHIYHLLVRYTRQALRYDNKVGIELIWNRMRWDVMVSTKGGHGYKLNQNFKAWYARLIMRREPDLAGVFEVRSRREG